MTAEAGGGHGSRVECLSAGAAGCLPKPFAKGQLLSVVRLAAAGGAAGRAATGQAPVMTIATDGSGYVTVYDGLGAATGHALLDASTTACGPRVVRGRGTEFSSERPPGARTCQFCNE